MPDMDRSELFTSCRKGNLDRVQALIEQREVDVNSRDKWDSTPLYYACLCGHKELVRYLLHNGARCSPSTFDGERCIYGALTAEIRGLLTDSHVLSARTRLRRPYDEFLRRMLESGEHSDVRFTVHGQPTALHRCVLAARCAYFARAFRPCGRWRRRADIAVRHPLATADAFDAVVRYVYTGETETRLSDIDDVRRLAKQLRLATLGHSLGELEKRAAFFRRTKPVGGRVTSAAVCPPGAAESLRSDLRRLADAALPSELRAWPAGVELPTGAVETLWQCDSSGGGAAPSDDDDDNMSGGATSDEDEEEDDDYYTLEEHSPFADVVFEVEGRLFWCHKAFFAQRSDYFRAVCRDPLGERQRRCAQAPAESAGHPPVFKLAHFTVRAFVPLLYYVYTDDADLEDECDDVIYEVLIAADLCLLPGLKRQCGNAFISKLDLDNCVALLRVGRLFELARLEDACYQFLAENLDEAMELGDFHALVLEDAEAIRQREDTDSIDVIDQVRFHLTAGSIAEAHEKCELIDRLLETLGLDA